MDKNICNICYLKYFGFTCDTGKCKLCKTQTSYSAYKYCRTCADKKEICIICGGNINIDPVVLYQEYEKLLRGKSENYIKHVTEKYENIVNGNINK